MVAYWWHRAYWWHIGACNQAIASADYLSRACLGVELECFITRIGETMRMCDVYAGFAANLDA